LSRGPGQTALAERYIEEGIRQDEHPLIYFREGAAGRRPPGSAPAWTSPRREGLTEAPGYTTAPPSRRGTR